jgi:hypothetical protein
MGDSIPIKTFDGFMVGKFLGKVKMAEVGVLSYSHTFELMTVKARGRTVDPARGPN